jgi:plastocyanin domain-containing protein
METTLIIIGASLSIAFIVWWFFIAKKSTDVGAILSKDGRQHVTVTVNGGYSPNIVTLKQGIPATIDFYRKDPSGCLSHVVFPDFGINEELPIGQSHQITIDTSTPGEYTYACGMNMFHGKVVIK